MPKPILILIETFVSFYALRQLSCRCDFCLKPSTLSASPSFWVLHARWMCPGCAFVVLLNSPHATLDLPSSGVHRRASGTGGKLESANGGRDSNDFAIVFCSLEATSVGRPQTTPARRIFCTKSLLVNPLLHFSWPAATQRLMGLSK